MGLRIALVSQRFVKGDGTSRVNYEIAAHALKNGHHVTVIANKIAEELSAFTNLHGVELPWSKRFSSLAGNLCFAFLTERWIHKHRSELGLLHVNGWITNAKADINTAHFVHGAWLKSPVHTLRVHKNMYGLYQWLYTYVCSVMEKQAFGQSRVVVAVSAQVKSELIAIGIPQEKIRVVHNGVDLEEFHPGSVDRKLLGLPEGVPLALFVGDIQNPRKNLDTVLKAMLDVPNLHLAVVGKTKNSIYPALAQSMGLAERVSFLGYRHDIAALMRAADLFVLPSRYEPFGLVILEALASGLPVITTKYVGCAELIDSESGIILDDPEDVSKLSLALKSIIENPILHKRMKEAALINAEAHSWKDMSAKYLKLYEEFSDLS